MVLIGDIPLETVYVDFISSSRSRRTPNNLVLVQMYCNKKVKAPNGIFYIVRTGTSLHTLRICEKRPFSTDCAVAHITFDD